MTEEEMDPPPRITAPQLIALLEEMCVVACCAKRRIRGETCYVLRVHDIYEGEDILDGTCRCHTPTPPA